MAERFTWLRARPEECGMSSGRLEALRAELERHRTESLLVIRDDRVLVQWHAEGRSAESRHYTASLAKALVGGTSLALALQDGLLGPDDAACEYIPQWRGDRVKSCITIRHLATHCSGLENPALDAIDRRQLGSKHSLSQKSLPGWKGAFWRREPNPFTIARDEAPVIFEPGSRYDYSNTGMAMLAYAVTAALRGTEHEDIRTLLRERVMRPIGVPDDEWQIGYGRTYVTDGLPLVANWGGGNWTPRAVARLGRLMLCGGDWDGRQILDPGAVERAVSYAGTPLPDRSMDPAAPASGLCWWVNHDGAWPSVPLNAFAGRGAGDQVLLVVPGLDLIAVRFGELIGDPAWTGADEFLFRPLMEAVLPPCPASRVIGGIEWGPQSSIVRLCHMRGRDGSDNWPLTWADDGDLYTAYGDGWGFDPPVPEKLSMGVARVSGDPPDVEGVNIRSDVEQEYGPGRTGMKASGILMVDGVLYMWLRNANHKGEHCRLVWSADHAESWTWADWSFRALGYCTFLNFGRNYEGARDDYVYVYSHDHPSAYRAADRMILARMPRDAVADRSAYEFFTRVDGQGRPHWARDISRRGAVFEHEGRCLRSAVTYNAGLERYLWWQMLPNHPHDPKVRFQGGFGVYDAPEPWGPWTTVLFTPLWDVGPGETGSFPTKWMSDDGRVVHLVFSGDDTFAVRRGRILLRQE